MKRFLTTVFPALMISLLILSGCGSDKDNNGRDIQNTENDDNSLRGKITVGAVQEDFALANQLASGYVSYNKNVIIDVEVLELNQIESAIEEGRYNIYLLNGAGNPKPSMESQIIACDLMVLCVNFNNPALQKLVIRGLKPSKIKEIFATPSILKWSDIVKTDEVSPVKAYLGAEKSSAYNMVRSFLGINQAPTVTASLSDQDLYNNISSNAGAIGFLSSVLAFDQNTLFRSKGLYVLPIDFNENNVADDNELIYDDFNMLKKAYSSNSYPDGLVRKHYFLWNKDVQQKEIVDDFILWINENSSSYIERNGFFQPLTKTNSE
jgi:ABC-type phosphate transport system substrate-binding protein